MKTRRPINRDIPEAEGLDDSDFEELEDILVRIYSCHTVEFSRTTWKSQVAPLH